MVHVVYGEALPNFSDPYLVLDLPSLNPTVATRTVLTVTDMNGAGITITGTGLKYAGGTLTAGTASQLSFFDSTGAPLVTISDAAYDAGTVAQDVLGTQSGRYLFAGDDLIEGSTGRDLLGGAGGNDTIHGGAGGDVILAMDGRDSLYGDAGKDMFVFLPNKGTDRIMDFADNDRASDDVIMVDKAIYAAMTISQSGHNVVLDFGQYGALVIVGAQADQIGADDFTFHMPPAMANL